MSDPFLPDTVTNFLGPGGKSHGPWPRPATVSLPTTQQLSKRDLSSSVVRMNSTMTSSGTLKA
eukprot:13024811-Alexandrium_andersonii.AAC.1